MISAGKATTAGEKNGPESKAALEPLFFAE